MQKCRGCGAEMPDDANKCSECGRQITKSLLSDLVDEAHETLIEKRNNGSVATSVHKRRQRSKKIDARPVSKTNPRILFLASIFCVLCTLLTSVNASWTYWIIGPKLFLFLQLLIFAYFAFLLKKRSSLTAESERLVVIGTIISGVCAFIFLMIIGMSLFYLISS